MTEILPDHPFHGKTDAELRYIVRDAGLAAIAMSGVNYQAECKYLDQVNDACTILNVRHPKRHDGFN